MSDKSPKDNNKSNHPIKSKSDKIRITLSIIDLIVILFIVAIIITALTFKWVGKGFEMIIIAIFWVLFIIILIICGILLIINYIANLATNYYKGKPKGLLVISLLGKIPCIPSAIYVIVMMTSNPSYVPYIYIFIILFPINIASIIMDSIVLRVLDKKEKDALDKLSNVDQITGINEGGKTNEVQLIDKNDKEMQGDNSIPQEKTN